VAAGVLSAGHARAILGLATAQAQEAMATRVVAEGLSVAGRRRRSRSRSPRTRSRSARRAPAAAGPVPTRLTEVADRLSDRFETRVKVDLGAPAGRS
jgi:ParB family chromosome partitioning protein